MHDGPYDVAVVGAGAVGLAAALGFAARGFSVCLAGPPGLRADGRTAALLDRSVRFLDGIGLADDLAAFGAPLRRMRIVDETGSLFRPPPTLFRPDEIGLDRFGWNIENAVLVERLALAARRSPLIRWTESLAQGLVPGECGEVALADGSRVTASLVCAADGRRSRLREAAGIAASVTRLPQVAVTTIVAHDRSHEGTSTEFHTRAGPCTLVPLPGDRSSVVWVTEPHHGRRLVALPDEALAAAITRRTHALLGRVTIDGPRGVVPLEHVSVERLGEGRLALLGEAAHVLPPIGAQGLNLGLADVDTLVGLAARTYRTGEDLGAGSLVRSYDRQRSGDVRLRSLGVATLNRALLTASPLVDAARGVGLGLLGQVGPLRRAAMRAGLT